MESSTVLMEEMGFDSSSLHEELALDSDSLVNVGSMNEFRITRLQNRFNRLFGGILIMGASAAAMGCSSTPETQEETSFATIGSSPLTVEYSAGAEELAQLQYERINGMMKFYASQYDIQQDVLIRILNSDDWETQGPPYGMPSIRPGNPLVITGPATADGVIVQDVIQYADVVPVFLQEKLDGIGLTFEEAAQQYPDLIVYHEAGHAYQFNVGLDGVNRWFAEFMASYFMVNYTIQHDPEAAQLFEIMSYATYLDGSTPNYVSLDDLERLYADGVGMQNYDWYQKQLNLKLFSVYRNHGADFIDAVIEAFDGKQVTSEETIAILEKLYPGEFAQWAQDVSVTD